MRGDHYRSLQLLYNEVLIQNTGLFQYVDCRYIRDHPYITSTYGLGEWVYKIDFFDDGQYCIYDDLLGGRVHKNSKLC